jgi:hypothetical protein
MAALGELFGSVGFSGFGGGGIISLILSVIVAGIALGGVIGFFFWIYHSKRKWFIKVEFKIPRSDGKLVTAEWGKGSYDTARGVVFVKRAKKKPVPMKPFDIKRYLQGTNILTVVQVGIEDYRPVLQESYIEMFDAESGEDAALIKAKIDTTESRAWRSTFEREAKGAYSLMGLLKEHFHIIALGMVIFLWGIQFLILYNRIKAT